MVSFCTQDSCAQNATPPSRGRENHESGPDGSKCYDGLSKSRDIAFAVHTISDNIAMSKEVLPDPVGPITRLSFSFWKNRSPSMCKVKLRRPGVGAAEADFPVQEKVAFRNPILVASLFWATSSREAILRGEKSSRSSVSFKNVSTRSKDTFAVDTDQQTRAAVRPDHKPWMRDPMK